MAGSLAACAAAKAYVRSGEVARIMMAHNCAMGAMSVARCTVTTTRSLVSREVGGAEPANRAYPRAVSTQVEPL